MTETPWILVRLAIDQGETQRAHIKEFAGKTLDEAVSKAMDWNSDRTNHGSTPSTGFLIERYDFEAKRWVPFNEK